ATVFRYLQFNPQGLNNMKVAGNYAGHVLEEGYGWGHKESALVMNLIQASSFFSLASDLADYRVKLIRDMKTSRFAKEQVFFNLDRRQIREEFAHVPDDKFYRAEQSLFTCF